ncbi:MAG: hypothetical protein QNJ46_35495 [Leptolyngbyaceae cyanobacterium MO_188.B28]|nr:hypothetical protein [Leptolyngbyaceae cyanobacterium MO_188.B28]
MISETQFNSIVEMVAHVYTPELPRHEADVQNLNLNAILAFGDFEEQLLTYYTELSDRNLVSLSPTVHIWFLRRLYSKSSSAIKQIEISIRVFLLVSHCLCRYLAARILVEAQGPVSNTHEYETDEKLEEDGDVLSPIVRLWRRIYTAEHFSTQEKAQLSKELARLLLDIQSERSAEALEELHQAQLATEGQRHTFVQEEKDHRKRHTSEEQWRVDRDYAFRSTEPMTETEGYTEV